MLPNTFKRACTLTPALVWLVVFTQLVRADVNISEARYEGRANYVIETDNCTWWYDRLGGGFSRLIDREGRDWIAFHKNPLSQFPESAAAGFRGIPNCVFVGSDKGAGHPGFDQCESQLVGDRSILTRSVSGKWSWRWTFTEDASHFEMLTADPEVPWWFLYEGPVGGTFEPSNKYWGTDKGGPRREIPTSRTQHFEKWRWVYFGDRDVGRVLAVVQHQADELDDNLWYLGSSERGAASAADGMIVFGFGRGPGTKPLLTGAGLRFTVKLFEQRIVTIADHARLVPDLESILLAED